MKEIIHLKNQSKNVIKMVLDPEETTEILANLHKIGFYLWKNSILPIFDEIISIRNEMLRNLGAKTCAFGRKMSKF